MEVIQKGGNFESVHTIMCLTPGPYSRTCLSVLITN